MKILSRINAFIRHPVWHYTPSKIAALVKADWKDELVPMADYQKVRKDFADLALGQVGIRDIAVSNGTIGASMTTELAGVMAESFLKTLDERNAENYIEFGFKRKGDIGECVTVTIKREHGKTAHQIRAELEAKHDAITKMIARFLIAHRDTARTWIEAFIECGAIKVDFNYHQNYPYIEPVLAHEDKGGVPWCEPCGSWHDTPKTKEHHAELKCRAPWKGGAS
jgi:hypothetical protein